MNERPGAKLAPFFNDLLFVIIIVLQRKMRTDYHKIKSLVGEQWRSPGAPPELGCGGAVSALAKNSFVPFLFYIIICANII